MVKRFIHKKIKDNISSRRLAILKNPTVEKVENIVAKEEKIMGKPKDEADRIKTIANLQETLKCQIANNLWDLNELYRVYSETDPIVQRALQELQKAEKWDE